MYSLLQFNEAAYPENQIPSTQSKKEFSATQTGRQGNQTLPELPNPNVGE
jgi:hypothetical protein